MGFRKPSEELSATEIISRSFGLYSTRFLHFFIPFLFAGVVNGMFGWMVRLHIPQPTPPIDPEDILPWFLGYLGALIGVLASSSIIFWIVSTIATGVAVKYASGLLEKGDANLQEGFNFVVSRLASLLVGGIVAGTLIILGLICFVVPGVIVAIMFSLVVPVIIIEGRGALDSLGRSRRLVSHRWGKTFVVLLLTLILSAILVAIGNAVGDLLGLLSTVAAMVASAFVQPLYPIALTTLYYSMVVKERPPVTPPSPTVPPAPPPAVQPRFCSQCGRGVPPEAIFCPHCGKKIINKSQEEL